MKEPQLEELVSKMKDKVRSLRGAIVATRGY